MSGRSALAGRTIKSLISSRPSSEFRINEATNWEVEQIDEQVETGKDIRGTGDWDYDSSGASGELFAKRGYDAEKSAFVTTNYLLVTL